MKIAMMTNNYKPFIAGVPISVERLSDGLRANGHEVVVFAPDYEGQEEEKYIVRYRALIKGIVNGFSVPNSFDPHIERRFREGHFDVIHVHHPMLIGRTALYLSKKYRVPLCFTYHTRYEQYLHYIGAEFIQNAVPNYVNRYADKCDLVFAPTQSMQEYLEKNGVRTGTAVLPTGLDKAGFAADEEEAAGTGIAAGTAGGPGRQRSGRGYDRHAFAFPAAGAGNPGEAGPGAGNGDGPDRNFYGVEAGNGRSAGRTGGFRQCFFCRGRGWRRWRNTVKRYSSGYLRS